MQSSRTVNSVRNMFWGAINRAVSIVFPFIVRTIFIKVLGEEYLGLNSLYSSILQVLNLADLGFASAVVASMYKPIAEGNEEEICALMNLYRKIYRTIGLVILSIGLVLTPFIDKLINGVPPQGVNIYFLWILYLLNTVVSYLFFAYKVSLLNAHQRNDLTEKIGALCRAISSLLQIFVVVVWKNLYLYVILTILCSVAYNLFCSIECNRMYPQYQCRGNLGIQTKNNIGKNIGALAIQKIGNTVSLSLDAVVISAFLGLTTVAIYGNYFYIISAISTFIALIYSSITASIGNSLATETTEKNYHDFKKIFFLNTWIVGWCCICFMCLFQDFMKVWMGESLLFPITIVLTLVLRFFFEQVRKVVLTYKDAAGMWWVDKWRPMVGCVVNLILNVALVKTIGVAGVALSTIVSYAFVEMPWETNALFTHYFKKPQQEYYFIMLQSIVKLTICGGVTYLICYLIPLHGILAVVVKLIICLSLPNVLFVLMNVKNKYFLESKMLLIRSASSIIKRNS